MTTKTNAAVRKARIETLNGLAAGAMSDALNRGAFLATIVAACSKTPAQLQKIYDAECEARELGEDAPAQKLETYVGPIRRQLTRGYMAAALRGNGSDVERLAHVDMLIDDYAKYVDPADYANGGKNAGKDMPAIPNNKKGRRTKEQERAYGSARDRASRAMADAGLAFKRTTTAQKNESKTGKTAGSVTPSHNAPKPEAPTMESQIADIGRAKAPNAKEMVIHIQRMAASCLAYWNKNAKVKDAPAGLSSAIADFKRAVDAIAAGNI